jgi:acyl-[acyl-carrier-protein]-phospholipid O-acyltransferase / long-chain-fatty-acid--[acyl-carrier-protein] ligase
MYGLLRLLLRSVLRLCYRVRVDGMEHYQQAGTRVLIVANHTSFLDAVLLAAFFPDRLTFAIDTHHAQRWYGQVARLLVDLFPLNPMNPLSTKSLIKYVKEDRRAVIFPEGRITVTGSLMKIYQGPGLIADKSEAMVLPVRIEGAQYTPFSRLKGRVRLRWFPQISLTVLPPRRLMVDATLPARERRARAGQILSDVMTEMMFVTSNYRSTLVTKLLDAQRVHGGDHVIVEDIERRPLTYDTLMLRARVLGRAICQATRPGEYVGVLMPSMVTTVITFFGLLFYGRIPAMLNFTVGAQGMCSACATAQIRVVYTSRRFVQNAKLDKAVAALAQQVQVIYLDDLAATISTFDKLRAWLSAPLAGWIYRRHKLVPDNPAVVLFTSGSEGTPKGVVLSHANLLANLHQLAARVDFNAQDVILNALPLFHSFGLTAGTILPLLYGMKTFFYPSPLHYRIVPEIAYDINATIMFGTNTFLAGYARFAHPYDFNSLRYVFAGAEKLKDETRRAWEDKFGVRIFECYGATETSPGLTTNTAMGNKPGSVGRLLPAIDYHLEDVPGVADGGRLHVRGPNVMRGYLLHAQPGVLVPPKSSCGDGWYDTGDIVSIDAEGFVTIRGRAKRFAKIAGEMVSLTAVEALASKVWPTAQHAVVTVPDAQKGEQLVLITSQSDAARGALLEQAKKDGIGEINVPKKFLVVKQVPLLGTGKTDYAGAQALAAAGLPQ